MICFAVRTACPLISLLLVGIPTLAGAQATTAQTEKTAPSGNAAPTKDQAERTIAQTYTDAPELAIQNEVLPRISKDFNITFTKDPEGRATMGGSSGGAAAFTMAWFRPDLYHRVLTYSGTYVNQQWPVNPASPHGAWEYHEHLIPQS